MGDLRGTKLLATPPVAGSSGSRSTSARPFGWTSSGSLPQIPDANQVVDRRGKGEHPPDASHAPVAGLPETPDRLQPAEDLHDPFPGPLAQGIARLVGGAAIDGTRVLPLGHLRGDPEGPAGGDERLGIVRLVPAHGEALAPAAARGQVEGRLPLGHPGGPRGLGRHRQAMPLSDDQARDSAQGSHSRRASWPGRP